MNINIPGFIVNIPSLADNLELTMCLLAQYTEPHRKFHTMQHLGNLLGYLQWFEHDQEQHKDSLYDRDVLLWSIAFHDWFYVPGAKDNESRSADAAISYLVPRDILDSDQLMMVRKIILATVAHHYEPDVHKNKLAFNTGLMMDCDLAGIGESWENYSRASKQVYDEFVPVVGHEAFQEGRRVWIKSMLSSEHLFSHPCFRERFEEQARRNLQRDLATFGAQ
jgi:predicted metal-dependent HD superfamily phosphohydrolase